MTDEVRKIPGGLRGLAMFAGGLAVSRIDALDAVEAEGGLNRFESRMLKLAKSMLENENDSAATAMLILCYLAEEVGVKTRIR